MKKTITKKEFEQAEKNMNALLKLATQKGGFEQLSEHEKVELKCFTEMVNTYEETNYTIPLPETVQGLLELKMYEKKLKQKDLAKMLRITDTKLSEIMHNKRKPNVSFLKALHQVFGIDGNLLLKMV